MPISKTCAVCNQTFSVPPVRATTAVTCSRACKGILRTRQSGECWSDRKCEECSELFTAPPAQMRRRKFCSVQCKWTHESRKWSLKPKSEGGTQSRTKDGYISEYRPQHPFAVRGWVMQHRLVMEEWMREENAAPQLMEPVRGVFYLRRGIEVHHRSEKKDDNARDNLVACTRLAHRCMHHGKPVNAEEAWPLTGLVVRGMSLTLTFA